MTEENDQLPDEDEEEESPDQDPNASSEQQTGVSLEQLATEVATLKTQSTKAMRDFSAAVGRLNSLYTKLESGRGDTVTTVNQLNAQVKAVDGMLAAVLEDEGLDPKVRAKAAEVRSKVTGDSELANLKAEIDALKNGDKEQRQAPPADTAFEQSIVDEIESYGLSPDDPTFDWKGEATSLLMGQGPGATRTYFRTKIKELLASGGAADRRQERKKAAGEKVPAGNKAARTFNSGNEEEDIKTLIKMGIINTG